MLINSNASNIYFIYNFCSLVSSGDVHLNFMSDVGVSSYTVMLQPALASHIRNVESQSQFQSRNALLQYFMPSLWDRQFLISPWISPAFNVWAHLATDLVQMGMASMSLVSCSCRGLRADIKQAYSLTTSEQCFLSAVLISTLGMSCNDLYPVL